MRRTFVTVLSAAALSVSGCSHDVAQPIPSPLTKTSTAAAAVPPADPGPLPAPEALSEVMSRLADPAFPGAEKLALVQNTVPPDAAALDRFATALRDTGFTPVTVSASEIRWSDNHPGNALATIKITGPDSGPNGVGPGEFSFPMEFRRTSAGWQLTRETAEELLAFGNARTEAPGPPPPAPTPPP